MTRPSKLLCHQKYGCEHPTSGMLSCCRKYNFWHYFPFWVWVWIKKQHWVNGHGWISIPSGDDMDSLCYTCTWNYPASHFLVSISHFPLLFFFKRKAHLLLWYWKVDHEDLLVNGLCCWCLVTKKFIFYLNTLKSWRVIWFKR